jgi:hypothetical protein
MSRRKGQSTLEYAIIIAVVVGGLMVMQHYVKRGYQGRLKSASDDMGQQFDPLTYGGTLHLNQTANVTQTVSNGVTLTTQNEDQVSSRTGNETQNAWDPTKNAYGQ